MAATAATSATPAARSTTASVACTSVPKRGPCGLAPIPATRVARETPLALMLEDGTLVEGVVDAAFEEASGWTVVDFKTDAELAGELPRYRRQVGLYASVVARATGKNVTAVLMQL